MDVRAELATEYVKAQTRRQFFHNCWSGVGAAALASLLDRSLFAAGELAPAARPSGNPLAPKPTHFPARAKHVIYLHMAGSPPQLELFDFKPKLQELNGKPCPDSLLKKERFAFIKGVPKMLGTPYKFARHGSSGMEMSELLPMLSSLSDELVLVRSMFTEQLNHAPAQIFLHTGSAQFGRPSMGSWLTYGLGSETQSLPGFVVLVSGDKTPDGGTSLWGSGFLPTVYQGVQCRSQGDPVLYISNPDGMDAAGRRRSIDAIRDLNQLQLRETGDPEIVTRIEQYELAYRMQSSVPELMDVSSEPKHVHEMYGTEPGKVSFANNCLLARRLVERGVRFVQLYDWGWDLHGTNGSNDIVNELPKKARQMDRPCAALIRDLKQRGLLDETLVIWGGEFGRTPMNEERDGSKFLGRDHHPHAFSIWMAGGGVKGGITHGATDELGYHAVDDKVHVHDLQATILRLLGLDHKRLTYKFQGRQYRLTDVYGEVVEGVIA
jgi:hypothetical protein